MCRQYGLLSCSQHKDILDGFGSTISEHLATLDNKNRPIRQWLVKRRCTTYFISFKTHSAGSVAMIQRVRRLSLWKMNQFECFGTRSKRGEKSERKEEKRKLILIGLSGLEVCVVVVVCCRKIIRASLDLKSIVHRRASSYRSHSSFPTTFSSFVLGNVATKPQYSRPFYFGKLVKWR